LPLSYLIDVAHRVVRVNGSGTLTELDILDWREEVLTNPAFDSRYPQLLDLREVTTASVSVPAMARIVASSIFATPVRRAIVCQSDEQYSFGRTFATLGEAHHQVVHVFRDAQVAEEWLLQR
jgi:hypothetical protein